MYTQGTPTVSCEDPTPHGPKPPNLRWGSQVEQSARPFFESR